MTSRKSQVRLHRSDGCYRARKFLFAKWEFRSEAPPPETYHTACEVCWKDLAQGEASAGEDSSSSTSSSSTARSSQAS